MGKENKGGNMSTETNIARSAFSDLEKVIVELTRLQKENLDLLYEIATTKKKVEAAQALAQIESKVYSGIKKFFKTVIYPFLRKKLNKFIKNIGERL